MTSTLIFSVVLMSTSTTAQDHGGIFMFFFSDTDALDGVCATVLSLLEMHSRGNIQRPRCHPSSLGFLGASDLILIYYWGGLRSAAPMGGGPCSTILRHLRAANALVRI